MLRARQGQKICYGCRRRLRQSWTQASMSWLASTEASEAKPSLSYLVVSTFQCCDTLYRCS
jgi:hypothetical protein